MMPSPPIDDRHDPCYSRWLAAGSDQTRIRPPGLARIGPQILSCNVQIARSHRCAHPGFAANRPRQPLLSNLCKPSLAANPHSARRPPLNYRPRFRALALFRRRPPARVDCPRLPASENLHNKRHFPVAQSTMI